jgi:hypothetical protein
MGSLNISQLSRAKHKNFRYLSTMNAAWTGLAAHLKFLIKRNPE